LCLHVGQFERHALELANLLTELFASLLPIRCSSAMHDERDQRKPLQLEGEWIQAIRWQHQSRHAVRQESCFLELDNCQS
jgi:hypothetical protein